MLAAALGVAHGMVGEMGEVCRFMRDAEGEGEKCAGPCGMRRATTKEGAWEESEDDGISGGGVQITDLWLDDLVVGRCDAAAAQVGRACGVGGGQSIRWSGRGVRRGSGAVPTT